MELVTLVTSGTAAGGGDAGGGALLAKDPRLAALSPPSIDACSAICHFGDLPLDPTPH